MTARHTEAPVMTDRHTARDPWGRFRYGAGETLRDCFDYADRLRRSLTGEIAPDLHYFGSKAQALRDAATRLVHFHQDAERRLRYCDAAFDHTHHGEPFGDLCTLQAGHPGDHGHAQTAAMDRTLHRARDLARQAELLSDTLAEAVKELDPAAGITASDATHQTLRELTQSLHALAADAERLAVAVTTVRVSHRLDLAATSPAPHRPEQDIGL